MAALVEPGCPFHWLDLSAITRLRDQPFHIEAGTIDKKIEERIEGELMYLDGASIVFSTILNKTLSSTLKKETRVYTEKDEDLPMAKELHYASKTSIPGLAQWKKDGGELVLDLYKI